MSALETEPRYVLRSLNEADARQICTWRYPGPYDFYDIDAASMPELLDPAHHCVAVEDESGELVGFFTFGESARVRGAARAGLYREPALDLGLGMRPDLTGSGHGLAFVGAALDYAAGRFQPSRLRLVVATFNTRAIRVYERLGFEPGPAFTSPVRETEVPFLLMTRSSDPR